MGFAIFWFIAIAVLWTGFFVLEGFDFGVGMLHWPIGRTDTDRRVAINAIGPTWDGNEVWLIVAGAGTFAAFPAWYASMFSTFYLALVLVLVALIVRGVAFEFRAKRDDPRWRATWSWALGLGSAVVPLVMGIALGDLRVGLPLDAQHEYTGNFFTLFRPYGVWTGVTLLVLCVLHGAVFLTLRTTGALRERAQRVSQRVAWLAVAFVVGFVVWSAYGLGDGVVPNPLEVVAVLAVVAAALLVATDRDGSAFIASCVAIGTVVASLFVNLYPDVMVSSTSASNSLTVANAASGTYALKVMTVVAVVFLPLVLAYQAWSYWVFHKRLTAPPSAPSEDTTPASRVA
jgi:cytochrome bd ubiquinol oxidase subunit II